MKNEYMNRMEVLAEEINNGENLSYAIGIRLDPPTVEWCAPENMHMDEYEGIFFFEGLYGVLDNLHVQWDSDSLAEYLEQMTREFVSENEMEI